MSVTRPEPAGAERGAEAGAGRRGALAPDIDSENAPGPSLAQEEQMERERLIEIEEQRRTARVKRLHAAMDKRMNQRAHEAMERRLDWYIQVGIHRAFARDCAKYMAGASC